MNKLIYKLDIFLIQSILTKDRLKLNYDCENCFDNGDESSNFYPSPSFIQSDYPYCYQPGPPTQTDMCCTAVLLENK